MILCGVDIFSQIKTEELESEARFAELANEDKKRGEALAGAPHLRLSGISRRQPRHLCVLLSCYFWNACARIVPGISVIVYAPGTFSSSSGSVAPESCVLLRCNICLGINQCLV